MKRREKRMKEKLAKKSKVGEEDVAASSIVDGLFVFKLHVLFNH